MPGDVGQFGINDAANQFNTISFIVRQAMAQISTIRAVKVVAVHLPNKGKRGQVDIAGTIDVQLLTNQVDGEGNQTPRGIVYGIPYHRLQSGDSAHIVDPVVGDIGLAHIADRDLSSNISNRGQGNPGSNRRFSPSDSIYYGGILNGKQGKDPKQYLTWHDKGTEWGDRNKNRHTMDDKGMVHTDGVNNQSRVFDKNGITDSTKQTHTINADVAHVVNTQTHNINAQTHNIAALTNIPNLLKVANVALASQFLGGLAPGGTSLLKTGRNLIGTPPASPPITLASYTLLMPAVDFSGNPLTDGIGVSISFANNITSLSWGGTFATGAPAAVTAGQVFNFSWCEATSSWWNA